MHLERALEAVKARSTRALANEESYMARIKELERMNRALVVQMASLGANGESAGRFSPDNIGRTHERGNGGVVESAYSYPKATEPYGSSSREREGTPSSPPRMHRAERYKTRRTKTNRLSVERVDIDHRGSDVVLHTHHDSADDKHDSSSDSGSVSLEKVARFSTAFAAMELAASRPGLEGETRGDALSASCSSLDADGAPPRMAIDGRIASDGRRPVSGAEDGDANSKRLSSNGRNVEKSAFQLLLCNDDGCEVREPRDRAIRQIQHGVPHSRFAWVESPKNVLVVKKPNDANATAKLIEAVRVLSEKNITAYVEPAVHWETDVGKTWSLDDDPRLDEKIDFIICLGGDGTILWVSNLFPNAVPPVLSFSMGSLGFLTAFEEDSFPRAIDDVVRGDFFFTPRSRLAACVVDGDGNEEKLRYVCLNEVVVDRGASAALVDLDVNIDGNPMTKVLADGVMISTPTGSTAYALAAGGSMVHPGVSGVLFVPICPHTLSFRPLVLPDTSVLTITVPHTARNEPVASFDGKRQRTLRRGESLVVAGWRYPVPGICKSGETGDWFRAVKDSLLWNARGSSQKPMSAREAPGR